VRHTCLTPPFPATGGLTLRVSSAADILTEKGKPRSDKSVSPVQTEADENAFGTREAKVQGAELQREAWRKNSGFSMPVFGEVRPPLPKHRRFRGQIGRTFQLQQRASEQRLNASMLDEEARAKALFRRSTHANEIVENTRL